MSDLMANAIAALRSAGWAWEPADGRRLELAKPGHRTVPAMFRTWATSFGCLSSNDEAVWFLSAGDYTDSQDDAFSWAEFEIISRDAAQTEAQSAAVSRFWDRHLPILLSVRGGYSYVAIVTSGVGLGEVVFGTEPLFEETTLLADDFAGFLDAIAGSRGSADVYPWTSLFR